MVDLRRRIAGKQAKSHGEEFENILKANAYVAGFEVLRIPDGCRQVGHNKLIRVRSPFDFVFIKSKTEIVFIDAKSTNNKTFSKSAISEDQLHNLSAIEKKGHIAGYIIYFRSTNQIIFFSVAKLKQLAPRQSLQAVDGTYLGNRFRIDLGLIFHSL